MPAFGGGPALSQRLAQSPREHSRHRSSTGTSKNRRSVGRARLPQTVPNRSRSPTTATAWTLPTCCRCCCVGEPVCRCTAVRSSTCGSVARYSVVIRGSVDPDRLGTVGARTGNRRGLVSRARDRSRSSRHGAVPSFYRARCTAGTFLVLPCPRYRALERRWDSSSFGNNETGGVAEGGCQRGSRAMCSMRLRWL